MMDGGPDGRGAGVLKSIMNGWISHAWGAAWGIQKRFSQRFCIETVLTQKSSQGYCLEDVAILSQRKSSSREQPSYLQHFGFL